MVLPAVALRKVFPSQRPDAVVERGALDGRVRVVERIQRRLDVELVRFREERAHALLVPRVVQEHEPRPPRGDVRVHEQIVEPVHELEVRLRRLPSPLVDDVERGVRDELLEVRRVLPLRGLTQVRLVQRDVRVGDDRERREADHRDVRPTARPRDDATGARAATTDRRERRSDLIIFARRSVRVANASV
eukprot:29605-Pelagococcus_subviridis.AAC.9